MIFTGTHLQVTKPTTHHYEIDFDKPLHAEGEIRKEIYTEDTLREVVLKLKEEIQERFPSFSIEIEPLKINVIASLTTN